MPFVKFCVPVTVCGNLKIPEKVCCIHQLNTKTINFQLKLKKTVQPSSGFKSGVVDSCVTNLLHVSHSTSDSTTSFNRQTGKTYISQPLLQLN